MKLEAKTIEIIVLTALYIVVNSIIKVWEYY